MKTFAQIAICVGLIGTVVSCGKRADNVSSATGVPYANPTPKFDDSRVAPGLVFVEGGTYTMGLTSDEFLGNYENPARKVTIASFFIDRTEVSNADYREYVKWLAAAYPEYPAVSKSALPDTNVWMKPLAYNEPLAKMYFRHPAYNDYPVVGVSWLQASDFCIWRTNRVNEQVLLKAGLITAADIQNNKGAKTFDTEVYTQGLSAFNKANQPKDKQVLLFPSYRLPTEAEWEFAARPQELDAKSGLIENEKIYPWAGSTVRGQSKESKGHLMANFQKGRGDLKGPAGTRNTNAPTPLPVTSYAPNRLGLYNMAGNVNEWVMDVYRPLSYRDIEDYRPYRGNVTFQYKRDDQGNLLLDSLGRIVREVVKDESGNPEDFRGFKDGDAFSNLGMNGDMYSAGKGKAKSGAGSLISNTTRVFKGGSFTDRAYWLNPATRRYLEENKAQVDIGFRCVMDYFGPK